MVVRADPAKPSMNGAPDRLAQDAPANGFSIVVPTRGRGEQLRSCLEAICELDYPAERFEVIVVDDGSTAPLDALRRDFETRVRLTLVAQRPQGPAAARNAGARLARFDILAFTDDDCRPAPDWLAVMATSFARSPDVAVAGRVVNAHTDNWFAEASAGLVDFIAEYYNAEPEHGRFGTCNNLAVPAEAFRSLGGFDPGFTLAAGEDRDFCDRWCAAGRRIDWRPDALVHHLKALTLHTFIRQQFNYGRGAYRYRRGRATRLGARLSLERPSFYLGLLRSAAAARRSRVAAVALTGLLGLAQVVTLAGFVVESVGVSRRAPARPE